MSLESEILRGRPFGGVGHLWHKSLSSCIPLIGKDISGRCIAARLTLGSRSFIICCVYFPCVTSSYDYKVELSHFTGFINSIASADYLSEIIIIGDMNFPCHTPNTELETVKEWLAIKCFILY